MNNGLQGSIASRSGRQLASHSPSIGALKIFSNLLFPNINISSRDSNNGAVGSTIESVATEFGFSLTIVDGIAVEHDTLM
jgi:hypothetical protein